MPSSAHSTQATLPGKQINKYALNMRPCVTALLNLHVQDSSDVYRCRELYCTEQGEITCNQLRKKYQNTMLLAY